MVLKEKIFSTSRALHGPGVARPRTQPQKRHACVLSTCRDASRDPFALKRCVLETCGTSKLLAEQPTSRPSKPIILSVTRVVSGASTHTCTETLRMLTLAPPKRLPGPICTQNVLTPYGTSVPPRARASLGRASNLSLIKMHHIERCTGPEWRAHAHARRNAPHACFGHARSMPRALCSHMVLAMAPLIARARVFE